MDFRNPFKHHNKQHGSDNQVQAQPPYSDTPATHDHEVAQDAQKRTPSLTIPIVKEPQPSSTEQAPPSYTTPAQPQPPRYRSLRPDPFDPAGPAYGFQYEENAQNFPHPSSVAKDIGKPMTYTDPKAAELARRASQSGREDMTEMMNYFLRQQELGKKSIDKTIAAWNGI